MVDIAVKFARGITPAGVAAGAATGRAGGNPLVGRTAEIAQLDAVFDRLGRGSPAVVDLTGAAGIGKSRLVGELCLRAERRGVTVLRGRATEYEQHLPFQPFAEAIADADDRGPSAATELLAALSPAMGGRATGPSPVTAPAVDRFALHRSTARLLAQLGTEGLLVALDDMHWADPASLELLDHLVRHPVPGPVVLVVARRDRQTPPALTVALTRGLDTGAVIRIGLGPLPSRNASKGSPPTCRVSGRRGSTPPAGATPCTSSPCCTPTAKGPPSVAPPPRPLPRPGTVPTDCRSASDRCCSTS